MYTFKKCYRIYRNIDQIKKSINTNHSNYRKSIDKHGSINSIPKILMLNNVFFLNEQNLANIFSSYILSFYLREVINDDVSNFVIQTFNLPLSLIYFIIDYIFRNFSTSSGVKTVS